MQYLAPSDGPKGENKEKTMMKGFKAVNRNIAQLAKQMGNADIGAADDASDASESSSEETQARGSVKFAPGTNRTNSSLTRQTTKKTK